ncbi:MAG: hypothetical protein IKX71_01970 [Bacteroidales bacterium]|nr:hypothetical protein [Bacteroidales bacterium]
MKRFILIAACTLFALASCSKPEEGEDNKLSEPVSKSYHASFTLNDTKFEHPIKNGDIPKTIDITSGGKFLLGFLDTDAIEPEKAPLKYISGLYEVVELKAPGTGLKFIFGMYGSLIVKQDIGSGKYLVDYIEADGTSYEGDAILTDDILSTTLANELCRSWKPHTIIASASGGKITDAIVSKKFSNNMYEILSYIKEKGVLIDPEPYAGYSIESIDYTESGLFIINFKDFAIAPFVGNFSLNENKEENIAFNFNLCWEDNPVIPVSGTGIITITGNQMSFYTESDAEIEGDTYHFSITLLCNEIK